MTDTGDQPVVAAPAAYQGVRERSVEEQRRKAEVPSSYKAAVLLSGGQDSTTILHMAVARHGVAGVSAVFFDYGQRHLAAEREAVRNVLQDVERAAGVPTEVPLTVLNVRALAEAGESALTGEGDVGAAHPSDENLPASFVPARNAVFLSLAYAAAQRAGAGYLYGGMCQTDYSGYPDCRQRFVDAMQVALQYGYGGGTTIATPLMNLNKAETWALAWSLGPDAFMSVLRHSRTCYEGSDKWNEWGYGCGECPACVLRRRGYEAFSSWFATQNGQSVSEWLRATGRVELLPREAAS